MSQAYIVWVIPQHASTANIQFDSLKTLGPNTVGSTRVTALVAGTMAMEVILAGELLEGVDEDSVSRGGTTVTFEVDDAL